jgi:hypothetical protein
MSRRPRFYQRPGSTRPADPEIEPEPEPDPEVDEMITRACDRLETGSVQQSFNPRFGKRGRSK